VAAGEEEKREKREKREERGEGVARYAKLAG